MLPHRPPRLLATAAATALLGVVLAGCVAEETTEAAPTPTFTYETRAPAATPGASSGATATPSPGSTAIPIPTDCESIVSAEVLDQLAGTPLNDPGTGVSTGVQPDGSLVCLWRDPRADVSNLMTTISAMSRGPALDLMNEAAEEQGLTCYTPDDGIRCDGTWQNEVYPVTDGRTLFWRDDILLDTSYSNLAPRGYTDSLIASVFGG